MHTQHKDIVVIYHAECTDGFSAAYVAWKKFGDTADYIGISHNDTVPEGLVGKEIYLLDIAYDMAPLQQLIADNKRVVVLDHHVTREKEIKSAPEHRYGTDKSGVGLAWEYFYPNEQLPLMLACVQEGDLWQHRSSNIHELLAYVEILPFDFKAWDEAVALMQTPAGKQKVIELGNVLILYRDRILQKVSKNVHPVIFEGIRTLAINVNLTRSMISQLGNQMASTLMPPMAILWGVKHDRISVSLRGNGSVDVGALAVKYGGGGHKNAAAFSLPLGSPLPWRHDDSMQKKEAYD
jgi:hypothetical protein